MAKRDEVAIIRKNVGKATAKFNDETFSVVDKRTEKAVSISNLLTESSWSKQDKDRLGKMLTILTGEEIFVNKDEELDIPPLVALRVLKLDDKNKHTYQTDTTVIHVGNGICISPDGKAGSPIPPKRDVIRPATEEEIAGITDAHVKGVMKEVQIMFMD